MNKDIKGRPTKFNKTIKRVSLTLAEEGKTNKQIANIVGVGEATFQRWLTKNPTFREELKVKKAEHDENLVESSLLEKCKRTVIKETKTRKDSTGRILDIVEIEKEVLPDTGAIKLFLENRSDKYSGRGENQISFQQNVLDVDFHGMSLRELQENSKDSILGEFIVKN